MRRRDGWVSDPWALQAFGCGWRSWAKRRRRRGARRGERGAWVGRPRTSAEEVRQERAWPASRLCIHQRQLKDPGSTGSMPQTALRVIPVAAGLSAWSWAIGPLATLMNVPGPGRSWFGRVRSTGGTVGRLSVDELDEAEVEAVEGRSERAAGDADCSIGGGGSGGRSWSSRLGSSYDGDGGEGEPS